jgi:hypothetical protein
MAVLAEMLRKLEDIQTDMFLARLGGEENCLQEEYGSVIGQMRRQGYDVCLSMKGGKFVAERKPYVALSPEDVHACLPKTTFQ